MSHHPWTDEETRMYKTVKARWEGLVKAREMTTFGYGADLADYLWKDMIDEAAIDVKYVTEALHKKYPMFCG